jgi:hypothetical protein
MVESGETMINCLAYIDLNPIHSVEELKGMVSQAT